jgi:hypothetical protein
MRLRDSSARASLAPPIANQTTQRLKDACRRKYLLKFRVPNEPLPGTGNLNTIS